MPTDLSSINACNYGTSSFQVEGYTYRQVDVVKEGIGRTGIRCEINIKGYLQGTDQADLSTRVQGFQNDSLQDGRDLIISGLTGATELTLLSAVCYDGGPHIAYEITDHDVPLTKGVQMTITASIIPPEVRGPGNTTPVDNFTVTIATRPDGLRTLTRSGELSGVNLALYFINVLLPSVRAAYASGFWVIQSSYQTTLDPATPRNTKLQYQVVVTENVAHFPQVPTINAVDGSATVRTDRDEQMRKTQVWDFDLLYPTTAAMDLAVTSLRQLVVTGLPVGAVILRETVTTETIKDNRLKASFTVLASASGNPQMNWGQSLRVTEADQPYEEITYIGADPILVQRPRTFPRATQTGRSVSVNVWRRAPSPFYPILAGPREFTLSDLNAVEKQTDWSYSMFLIDSQGNPLDLYAPANIGALVTNLPRNIEQGFYPAPPPPPPPPGG